MAATWEETAETAERAVGTAVELEVQELPSGIHRRPDSCSDLTKRTWFPMEYPLKRPCNCHTRKRHLE